MKPPVKLRCEHCEQDFLRLDYQHRKNLQRGSIGIYCSRECFNAARTLGQPNYVSLSCDYCGIKFNKLEREYKQHLKLGRKHLYCSSSCYDAARQDNSCAVVEVQCCFCGQSFSRSAINQRRLINRNVQNSYCSHDCKVKHQTVLLPMQEVSTLYESELWSLQAIGQRFGVSAATIRARLLSSGVRIRSRTEAAGIKGNPLKGKPRSPEEREKTRAGLRRYYRTEEGQRLMEKLRKINSERQSDPKVREAARQKQCALLSSGKIPASSTLEMIVAGELRKIGLAYEQQVSVQNRAGKYLGCVDFYVPEYNLVIEVNGTYWHSDPRRWPTGPVHESQKNTFYRYQKKVTSLREMGWLVAEIWEIDLKEDATQAVEQALRPLLPIPDSD